jgi:hypothetical protein
MHTFETTDIKVARRFRGKQFKGESAAFSLAGTIIVGLVKSVSEHKASVPACWTITIVPKTLAARQPGSASHAPRFLLNSVERRKIRNRASRQE